MSECTPDKTHVRVCVRRNVTVVWSLYIRDLTSHSEPNLSCGFSTKFQGTFVEAPLFQNGIITFRSKPRVRDAGTALWLASSSVQPKKCTQLS